MEHGPSGRKITSGLDARLRYIDSQLFWLGSLNRGHIVQAFDVTMVQASADIGVYRDRAPSNLYYDPSQKSYRAGSEFTPLFPVPQPHQVLASLVSGDGGQPWAKWFWTPEISIIAPTMRIIDQEVFRQMLTALRSGSAISIVYQSSHAPRPEARTIVPLAIGYDGLRFYVRSYCLLRNDFRDFLFSRIIATEGMRIAPASVPPDESWHDIRIVMFRPDHTLPPSAQAVVAYDYGMSDGIIGIPCRRAMLLYLLRFLHQPPRRVNMDRYHEARSEGLFEGSDLELCDPEEIYGLIPISKDV